MTSPQPKIDAVYQEYADALLHHHFLLSSDKEQEGEVQQVEDRLDALWEKLDNAQQDSLRGLSSDLNWIRRHGQLPPNGRSASAVSNTDRQQLQAAQNANDWHTSLHQLRVCAASLPPDLLAYTRAPCYFQLGLLPIAVEFTDFTLELGRGTSPVARLAFEALMRLAPGVAFRRATELVRSASVYPPVVVVQSIGYLLDTFRDDPSILKTDSFAPIIREAYTRLDAAGSSASDQVLFFQLAGAEMQAFGQHREARELYEKGYSLDQNNQMILSGLAKSIYDSDPERAVSLFRKATQLKAAFIQPYLFLAHYHLVRGDFALSYHNATEALTFATDDRGKAVALEIKAISASNLQFPAFQVLRMLNEAARLAPDSSRIAWNLNAVLKSVAEGTAMPTWNIDDKQDILAVRSFTALTPTAEPKFVTK